jgi:hypothetical protein
MEDLVCLALSFLGLMSMLKGESANSSIYEADFTFHPPASAIPRYNDDEQNSQAYRRTRVKARRTNESL